jgi:hypothetical protein
LAGLNQQLTVRIDRGVFACCEEMAGSNSVPAVGDLGSKNCVRIASVLIEEDNYRIVRGATDNPAADPCWKDVGQPARLRIGEQCICAMPGGLIVSIEKLTPVQRGLDRLFLCWGYRLPIERRSKQGQESKGYDQ